MVGREISLENGRHFQYGNPLRWQQLELWSFKNMLCIKFYFKLTFNSIRIERKASNPTISAQGEIYWSTVFSCLWVVCILFPKFCRYFQHLLSQIPLHSFLPLFVSLGQKLLNYLSLNERSSSRCTRRGFPYWKCLPFFRKYPARLRPLWNGLLPLT